MLIHSQCRSHSGYGRTKHNSRVHPRNSRQDGVSRIDGLPQLFNCIERERPRCTLVCIALARLIPYPSSLRKCPLVLLLHIELEFVEEYPYYKFATRKAMPDMPEYDRYIEFYHQFNILCECHRHIAGEIYPEGAIIRPSDFDDIPFPRGRK